MNKDIIFGMQPVLEAIKSGTEIDKILVQKNVGVETSKELYFLIKKFNIPFQKVPAEKLNKYTRKTHQGVIALVSSVSFANLDQVLGNVYNEGRDPFLLLLDRVTDVRNFGAIVRTAECAGVDAIVVPARGSAALNADAMKTSAGALNYVPICRAKYLVDEMKYLKESGVFMVGMTEKTEQNIYQADISGPVALVMGSEENGISSEVMDLCDLTVKIPMIGSIGSLNVSVAAGIGLYEIIRRRQ